MNARTGLALIAAVLAIGSSLIVVTCVASSQILDQGYGFTPLPPPCAPWAPRSGCVQSRHSPEVS